MTAHKRVATRLSEIEYALKFPFDKEIQRKLKIYFDATWQKPFWHVHAVSDRRKRAFRDFLDKENFAIEVPEEEKETSEPCPLSDLPWEE
jgi:hypothetical protein